MIRLLFFGITQDLAGNHSIEMTIEKPITVADLKAVLFMRYPNLLKFSNFAVAVNEQYAEDHHLINDNDVVAIIPPVSGG